MPDEATTPVLERPQDASPAASADAAAGLGADEAGADDAQSQEKDAAERERRKLQSERDRLAEQARKLKERLARAEARELEHKLKLEAVELNRQMLEVEHDPDQIRQVALKREEANYWSTRTREWLADTLEDFAEETGIRVGRRDPRLALPADGQMTFRQGQQYVKAKLEEIRAEAEGRTIGSADSKELAALKKQLEDMRSQMAALGVDRFDGGGGSSGGGALTTAKYLAMTSAERLELRRKNPRAIDEMLRRAR